LLDLKPGAIVRLSYPEVRISDCFDPTRVEIWIKEFEPVAYNGDICKRREHLVEVSTSPIITDRLGHFVKYRAEKTMAKLASKSAVDRSPGLKSQVSAEGNSDVENMGDPLVSQATFVTQIPYSPPKPAKKSSPQKTQSLGKRKVMGDLRQLVNDINRVQKKKTKFCTEDKRPTNTDTMLADVGQGDVTATSVEIAVEIESPPKKQAARSSPSNLGRPTKQEPSLQHLDGAREHPNGSQASLTRVARVTTSESRISGSDYQSNLLSRLRDQLTKTTYLPRYLQMISKAQNDLLATDAKWQPALVGQPTRPGTLPLELISCLTAAADQEAALVCEPVQSNRRVAGSLQDISGGQAGVVDEEPDLPSGSPILKNTTQAYDQIQSEAQKVESESEVGSAEWPLSSPRSSPPGRILPPDSSPVQRSSNMLVPSRAAEAASCESRKMEDPVPPNHSQCSSVKEVEKSSQPSPTGTLQDQPRHNVSMEDFEIDSSEDEGIPDANLPKSLSNNQARDEQADVSQQIMMEIQAASQIPSVAPEDADDGETAHSNHDVLSHEAISEDRVVFASDSTSSAKRKLDNADKKELSNHRKRAEPSSVLSVSSEDHDFRPVDNITRIYRRGAFSSLRTNATPLSPSTFLTSSISPQSTSIHSSDRRQSDHTSVSKQITTSAPLTRVSARGEKVSVERPTSTSDMSRGSALRPEDQFLVFKQSYPTYRGNLTQFLRSCIMIKKTRAAGKMLPQCVWDDFVYRHHHDYRSHLLDVYKSDELESPMPYEEYYADCVPEPLHLKGIIRLAFIDSLSLKMDPKTTLDTPPVREMCQLGHLEDSGRSVAASSSASNVQANEPLSEMVDKVIPKNDSTTLESQLQLREQEKAPQSQSTVHLWLQKASGAASPELGTSDSLSAADNIPSVDLTDGADFTLDLAQELLPLANPFADIGRGAPKASMEESRLPNAKTEPFKHFALEYAKLDVEKHEKLQIQADAGGARRANVQRIIDIFTWRA
jgi:hypothetical protein